MSKINCKVHGEVEPMYATEYLSNGKEKEWALCQKCELTKSMSIKEEIKLKEVEKAKEELKKEIFARLVTLELNENENVNECRQRYNELSRGYKGLREKAQDFLNALDKQEIEEDCPAECAAEEWNSEIGEESRFKDIEEAYAALERGMRRSMESRIDFDVYTAIKCILKVFEKNNLR
jgi:hypothetical protein